MDETSTEEIIEEVELKTDAPKVEVCDENESEEVVDEVKEDLEVTLKTSELEELQSFKDKYYYLAAEFENSNKRQERERDHFIKYGNEKILKALIDVVDNLDRSLDAIKDDEEEKVVKISEGLEMVNKQFIEVLKQSGLSEIEAIGKTFDPNFHEALAQQPAEGKEDQEIIQEYQKGYLLNGRLLRAAKVVIVKN